MKLSSPHSVWFFFSLSILPGFVLFYLLLVESCRWVAIIRNKWCYKSSLKSMRLWALRVRGSFVDLSVFPAHHAVSLRPEARGWFTDLYRAALSPRWARWSPGPPSPFKQEEYLEEIIESTHALLSVSRYIRRETEKDVAHKTTSW